MLTKNKLVQRDATGHIIPGEKAGYNERLFKKGFRRYFHEARFHWLRQQFERLKIVQGTFVELGCFDARSLDFIPFHPERYLGFDANWENGLDMAQEKWAGAGHIQFRFCQSPANFSIPENSMDFGISLETLEHLPENELGYYLEALQKGVLQKVFITVPIEMGPLALLKYLYKSIFLVVDEPYTARELWHLFWGNLREIERVPLGHKGFDYRHLKKILQQYFHIESETGLPFPYLPKSLNLSCALVLAPIKP